MNNLASKIEDIAQAIKGLCSYIDVRNDDNGPYIIAFGLKDNHSLQLRNIKEKFVLELWRGKSAEEEVLTAEPSYPNAESALEKAKEWLSRDTL